jgi:hypothetical protein
VVPDWYVPFEERLQRDEKSIRRKKVIEANQSAMHAKEKEKDAAMDALWASLSAVKREVYLKRASADIPKVIRASPEVTTVMAKFFAWEEQATSDAGS